MAVKSGNGQCKYSLLFVFIMLFNISISTSVSLDLTELRNKVSKFKGHPRGNLWATGHFMGKKSISNSQLLDNLGSKRFNNEQLSSETEDLRELISQDVLKVALQAELQDPKGTKDLLSQDTNFLMKLFKNYTKERNVG